MTVVFPKLAEGYRWFVTEPGTPYGHFRGEVLIQKLNWRGKWKTVRSAKYFPNIGGLDYSIAGAIKKIDPSDETRKYVGPH